MRYPYDVFESIFGAYDPEKPSGQIFSVWLGMQRERFLQMHPEENKNMIDGHFFEAARNRFFRWIDSQFPQSFPCAICSTCGKLFSPGVDANKVCDHRKYMPDGSKRSAE